MKQCIRLESLLDFLIIDRIILDTGYEGPNETHVEGVILLLLVVVEVFVLLDTNFANINLTADIVPLGALEKDWIGNTCDVAQFVLEEVHMQQREVRM